MKDEQHAEPGAADPAAFQSDDPDASNYREPGDIPPDEEPQPPVAGTATESPSDQADREQATAIDPSTGQPAGPDDAADSPEPALPGQPGYDGPDAGDLAAPGQTIGDLTNGGGVTSDVQAETDDERVIDPDSARGFDPA